MAYLRLKVPSGKGNDFERVMGQYEEYKMGDLRDVYWYQVGGTTIVAPRDFKVGVTEIDILGEDSLRVLAVRSELERKSDITLETVKQDL